jgi:hypothetical protein
MLATYCMYISQLVELIYNLLAHPTRHTHAQRSPLQSHALYLAPTTVLTPCLVVCQTMQ